MPAARALLAATDLTDTLASLDAGHANHATARTTVTPEQLGFPHAATAVAVTSAMTSKKTGATSGETRLFVSSLARGALTPRQWLARVRGHWAVENANHYRRDVTWREDAELARQARRACNLALLRSALLGAAPARRPHQPVRPLPTLRFPPCRRLAFPLIPRPTS